MKFSESEQSIRCKATAQSSKRSGVDRHRRSSPHQNVPTFGVTTQRLSHSTRKKYNIGSELEYRMGQDEALRASILSSLEKLSSELTDVDLEAFIQYETENDDHSIVVLRAAASYESVEEYEEIKQTVRKIVRTSEIGGKMIYTRIKRR